MGLFRMDPENSGMLGLYHIEFNHLLPSLFPSVGHTLLSYANHIASACNVRFLASKRLERGQERAYKKENECDNVSEARKKRNSIINSDADSGKTSRTKGDNSTTYSVTRSINGRPSDEERFLLPHHPLVSCSGRYYSYSWIRMNKWVTFALRIKTYLVLRKRVVERT